MRTKLIFLLPVILILTSCVQHTVVETGQQTIGSFIVTPNSQWNQIPKQFSVSGLPTWTVDGGSLNSLLFISDVEDGDTLFPNTNEKKYDTYNKEMLPNEIIELIESTLLLATNATIIKKTSLRPVKIGSDQGFEFEYEFVMQDEVPRKAYIAAAKKNEKLHVLIFQATKIHYFDSLINDVKNMLGTAVIKT